jgi:hypothetical protein
LQQSRLPQKSRRGLPIAAFTIVDHDQDVPANAKFAVLSQPWKDEIRSVGDFLTAPTLTDNKAYTALWRYARGLRDATREVGKEFWLKELRRERGDE